MFGVSSRDVLAALNQALARIDTEQGCLTHLNAVKSLRGVFRHRMGYEAEEVDAFMESLTSGEGSSVMEKFEEIIMEEVSKAYLETYGDLIDDLFEKYIREAEYARKLKRKYVKSSTSGYKRESVTGEVLEPDYKFLRSVEKFMQVSEKESDIFRDEILELKNAREISGRRVSGRFAKQLKTRYWKMRRVTSISSFQPTGLVKNRNKRKVIKPIRT